ncbi:GntR family transcriptional regulator [Glaciimonas sp. CA11.2]|uniref:GntR family transcriptional regulator n=1 Tax=unclassified Glaciimonas TaxID=2644401 RepID=UPI002AB5220D|nr:MULTISPECIES: GntR family transcriptional regulator [unclassified Glaciimonas]MDY7547607.1 GntR family transcriptional regulator [Glaciimonas sp. CA11.2]MEB0014378.1 GntR family transcriptional regulator [Glaciimonas sp. Cout2]MEB0084336.1 GntR family transcriptional regulator [Glaciimonas sp. Gout2]MEB0162455.1 GntR family transcriptional regulator [Glaciimonas sp. CA11.2]
MALHLSSRSSLADGVTEALRNAILDGSLKAGALLQEPAIAKELSVSRSPVREALIQLERENLVFSSPNRSTVVRRPTAEEIYQIYTIRAALEGIAASWAAQRSTPKLVASLRDAAAILNDRLVGVEPSKKDAARMGIEFHAAIAEASQSIELQRVLQSLRNQIQLVMVGGLASLSNPRAETVHAEHLELIAAIAEKNSGLAEKLANEHVLSARDRLVHANAELVE